MTISTRVCVVGGGGAAGLTALRWLRAYGHTAVGYEMAPDVGGTWIYSDNYDDGNGVPEEGGKTCFSAMYKSLITNLPKQVMAYSDLDFKEDVEAFPTHDVVCEYLSQYADHHALRPMIQFQTRVLSVRHDPGVNQWRVKVRSESTGQSEPELEEIFDAVVVCNGHYSRPFVPSISGDDSFKGYRVHSHSYREPVESIYKDKTVVVLGGGASGTDISAEVASVAKKVYHCYYGADPEATFMNGRLVQKPGVARFVGSNQVEFTDSSCADKVDIFMYATGYHYDFPFLDKGVVSTEDRQVYPLYKHIFHAKTPSLSFIGIPFKVIPFPTCEVQSILISRVLAGEASLPSGVEMMDDVDQSRADATARDGNSRHLHMLGLAQFSYCDDLMRLAGMGKSEFMGVGTMRDQMYSERVRARAMLKEQKAN